MARETMSEELKKYGYVFSLKKSLFLYGAAVLLTLFMGRLFSLNAISMIILLAFVIFLMPFFIRNNAINRHNQKRFSDVNTYMEQFMYSFEKNGKILDSLKDVLLLFENGTMRDKIEMAIHHIENSFDTDTEEQALGILDREYGFDGMKLLHSFALKVEKEGGEYRSSAAILLEQRRHWADRTYEYLKEKRHQRNKVIMSILSTLLLCTIIYFLTGRMNLNISSMPLMQVGTLIVLCLDVLIFYKADKKLSHDDIMKKYSDGKYEASLQKKIEKLNDKKYPDIFLKKKYKRKIERQIEKDFPDWLLSMALLLQNDNVQVSIEKSLESAPWVLKPHIEKLVDELRLDPTGIKPYLDLLSEYPLPEVRAFMKVLYSLSENGNGASSAELEEILKRHEKLTDRALRLENEDKMAGMTALFLAPQVTGGFKLILDLGVMFVMYLAGMGNMGG